MAFIDLSMIWQPLEQAAMRRLWRRLARRAENRTQEMSHGDCLILAPHPDDETLGCGGLIMRKREAGQRVHVAVATDGGATGAVSGMLGDDMIKLREGETIAACALLGVSASHIRFLGFPDGALSAQSVGLEAQIVALVQELSPSEIFVCALHDGHRDHVELARVVRQLHTADRLGGATLWEYPVWFWDFRSWRPEGLSNKAGFVAGLRNSSRSARHLKAVALDLDGVVQRKRKALACHRSQTGALEGELGWSGLPASFLEFFFRDRELYFEIARTRDGATKR